MRLANRILYLSFVLLLAGAMSMAQSDSATTGAGSSQDQDSSMSGRAAGATLRGCLSGSTDNYTLTDHNGTIYHLVGASSQLQNAVGHEVVITGAPDSQRTGVSDSTAANTASSFQVTSVRDVSSTCDRSGARSSGSMGPRDHNSHPMSEQPPTTDSHPKGAPGEGRPPQYPTEPESPHLIAQLQQPASANTDSPAAQNSNSSASMSSPATSTSQASQSVNSAPQQPVANDANLPATGHSGAHQSEVNTNSTNSGLQNTPAGNPAESGQTVGRGQIPPTGVGNGNPGTPPPVSSETPAAAQSPTNPNSQLGTSPANQTGMSPTEANNDAQAARQGELSTNPRTGQTTGRGVDNQGVNNPTTTNPNATPISPNSTSPQANQNDQNKPLYERQATDVPWANRSGNTGTTTTTTTTNPHGSSTTTTTTPPHL